MANINSEPAAGAKKHFSWLGYAIFSAVGVLLYLYLRGSLVAPIVEADILMAESLTTQRYIDQLASSNQPWPVSDDLRIVLLQKDDYEQSYTLGNWTPRHTLADVIEQALEKGAPVILADFWLGGKVPVILKQNEDETPQPWDDNALFLERLEQIFEKASQKGSKIIFISPYGEKPDPTNPFQALLKNHYPTVVAAPQISWGKNLVNGACWAQFTFTESTPGNSEKLGGETNNQPKKAFPSAAVLAYQQFKTGNSNPALSTIDPKNRYLRTMYILPKEMHQENMRKEIFKKDWPIDEMVNNPEGSVLIYGLNELNFAKPGDLNGKLVLIGNAYAPLADMHPSPFGQIAGAYLVANELNMLLTNSLPLPKDFKSTLLNIAVLVFLLGVILRFNLPSWLAAPATFLLFFALQVSLGPYLYLKYNLILESWLLPVIATFVSWGKDFYLWLAAHINKNKLYAVIRKVIYG